VHVLAEARMEEEGPTAIPSSQHAKAGGQTASPGGPTTSSYSMMVRPSVPAYPIASSCSPTIRTLALASPTASSYRTSTSSAIDGTYSPATMEKDNDDDLLDYEPSHAHDGMEINVIYLSSTDYSLLEEEVSWFMTII
jgi:hypothetical protein